MLKRYIIRCALLLVTLIAPAVVNPAAQVHAQTACTSELAEADDAYTFGRFDEAIDLLRRCVRHRGASSLEQQRAYRLLALSYIGKNDDRRARDNVRELLQINPDYRIDPDQDPPPFAEMVREISREQARQPADDTPTAERKKSGVSKWVLLGGGAVLAGVAAAVLLSGGGDDGTGNGDGPPQPTTLNEQEPNDTPAQAQVLRGTPPITVRGSAELGEGSGFGRLDDVGNLLDEFEDLYRVTITQAGIRITLRDLSSDGDIYLMDLNNVILAQSINAATTSETINIPGQAPGTYLVAVSISDDALGQGLPASTDYTLTVDGAISGANQRVAARHIQQIGGAALTRNFRLTAHTGDDVPLRDALPNPAEVTWTAYHDAGSTLIEYDGTEVFHFRPGRGFWVQSTAPLDRTPPSTALPMPAGGTYAVPLDAGWNIIANPFDAPLDWVAVQEINGITQHLWRWDGRFVQAETFEPARRGEAYYFMNLTRLEALTVPHPSTVRAAWSMQPPAPPALTLAVYREGRLASSVRAGFMDDAAPGFDGHDQLAPPGYFEAASLRLIRDVAAEHRFELADEFRPWTETGQQFEVMLKAPALAPVELRVEGLDRFDGYAAYLIDPARATVYDLRTRPVISLTPTESLSRFTLVMGTEAFTRAIRDEWAPEAIEMSNYPNPFNPNTRIAYTLPASAAREPVRLEVFDVTGQRVRVLVDGVQEPGSHQVTWDGTDAAGVPVASGVYLYRLQAGSHIQVRQMLLMK